MPQNEFKISRFIARILSFEEIAEFTKLAVANGITKVRLTGGEPLVRKNIVELVSMLSKIDGLEDLSMTTNSLLLSKYAKDLKIAGLNQIKKGDVLTVAEIAGIQRAKRTGELIPFCHPLQLWKIDVKCTLQEKGVEAECTTLCFGKTGVEMEALTGVNVALLTVYDMCKAVDKEMVIKDIRLVSKTKK